MKGRLVRLSIVLAGIAWFAVSCVGMAAGNTAGGNPPWGFYVLLSPLGLIYVAFMYYAVRGVARWVWHGSKEVADDSEPRTTGPV